MRMSTDTTKDKGVTKKKTCFSCVYACLVDSKPFCDNAKSPIRFIRDVHDTVCREHGE